MRARIQSWVIAVSAAILCVACGSNSGPSCDPSAVIGGAGTPAIGFSSVPPIGSTSDLKGTVQHVAPNGYNVVVYIYVNGDWWIKPYANAPLTAINCDGTWDAQIATGGNDTQATAIDAFLIPSSYTPPNTSTGEIGSALPQSLFQSAAAYATTTR